MSVMYTEYRILYLKGFIMISWFVVSMMAMAMSIFPIIISNFNIWITLIFGTLASFFPLLFWYMLTQKVRLGLDYIETVSLFGKKRIYIKDVNNFGVFVKGRYTGAKQINQKDIDDYDSDDGFFGYIIYLSTNPEFDLNSFRPKKHIAFSYRKDLFSS